MLDFDGRHIGKRQDRKPGVSMHHDHIVLSRANTHKVGMPDLIDTTVCRLQLKRHGFVHDFTYGIGFHDATLPQRRAESIQISSSPPPSSPERLR